MVKDKDDSFKPKLGRIRSRGGKRAKSYLNRVLHQLSAAGQSGFGASQPRRFTGSRLGRGNDAVRLRQAGHRFGPSYRRSVIKSRIVKLVGKNSGGLVAARAHLRYIQRGDRFGAAVAKALEQRTDRLIQEGLSRRQGQTLHFQRNLLRVLRQRELVAVGEKLAREMGLEFASPTDATRIEGVYKRPIQLASGKFAVITKTKEFTLVPWRQVLERQRGKMVGGVVRGSTVSFEFGRKRGVGLG